MSHFSPKSRRSDLPARTGVARLCLDAIDAAPDWLFLVAGLVIVGASLLLPPWMANRKLAWQLDVMRQQATHLDEQSKLYGELSAALDRDDPIMLERLAYEYLRLKPVGATVLAPDSPVQSEAPGDLIRAVSDRGRTNAAPPLDAAPLAIERWIARPMPHGQAYAPIRSRLVTTATGPKRFLMLAAGLLLILIAMLPTRERNHHEDGNEDEDVDIEDGGIEGEYIYE